ncbi:MAG: hypothetical protein WDM85_06940 [Caulobacteraceae bacterium]
MPDQPEYDPSVEYQKGTADLQAGRFKDAVTDFQHVVDSTPRAANAWLYLGMSKSGVGDEKGAERAYEKSVKLDDSSVQAHRQLALSLVKLKQTDKANAELALLKSKAATCGDTCSDAADLKAAIADVTTAMGAPSAANDVASHLSLATPQAGDGAYVRAVSLINEHRWDDALASLDHAEAAIGAAPGHPDLQGLRLASQGRLEQGGVVLQRRPGDRREPSRRDRILRRAEGAGRRHGRRPGDAGPAGYGLLIRLRRGGGTEALDRSRRRSGRLIGLAAAALAFGLAAAVPPPAPPLRAMRWLAPGADASVVLTRRPTECLAAPADAQGAYLVELGRAAFRTPLLLGGQAARAGIDCETCHRGGRNNPDFDFPGISGAPGTADVTTSVLSSHRGDGIDNPKPIPNLSGPKAALKVSQDPSSPALEGFIDGVVTQEFDGDEPPPAVLKGLAAYVRALSPGACPNTASEPVTAGAALADVRRTLRAALSSLDHSDGPSSALMVEAARSQLGDIDERYAGPALAPQRAALERAGADLAVAEADARRLAPGARADLTIWLADEPAWSRSVLAAEPASLYDPRRLSLAGR